MSTESESRSGLQMRRLSLALSGYAAVAVLLFWPMVVRIGTHLLSNDQFAVPGKGGDDHLFCWMYWWFQKALLSGHAILHCDWVFPPTGANLTFRGIPFLGALLTLPIGQFFGPVVGTNVMVLLLVIGGATAYYIFLKRTLDVGGFAAFCGGALFGFCPFFVWKAGGHYNLIGAVWWATCLGAVVTAYVRNAFSRKNAVIFALFLWATFWSSYVEFFMLGITLALTVGVWEAAYWLTGRRGGLGRRFLFFMAALPGVVSLLILRCGPGRTLSAPVEVEIALYDLIPSAKLSIFSWAGLPNRTEAVVPHSFVYFALIGCCGLARRRERLFAPTLILAGVMLCFTVDLFNVPSTLLRALPMGGGFRFFSRFIPFLFFFLVVFSCYGIDALRKAWPPRVSRDKAKLLVLVGLLVFAGLELYPFLISVTPVRHFPLSEEARSELQDGRYLLVVPDGSYFTCHEGYQVDLDVPAVYLTHWWHMDLDAKTQREAQFPAVYNGIPRQFPYAPMPDPVAEGFLEQCRELNVGFLLFENKEVAGRFVGNGEVLFEDDAVVILKLTRYDAVSSAS